MATISALSRYIGDDWTINVAVQDGTGAPIDLTSFTLSALFFVAFNGTPVPLTAGNGSVTVTNAAGGALTLMVAKSTTAGATAQGLSQVYANRIQVIATDAGGRQTTLGVVLIAPVAP